MAFIILFYPKVMRKENLVEAGGVEPPSASHTQSATTCLVWRNYLAPRSLTKPFKRNASSFNLAIQYTATLNGEFAK